MRVHALAAQCARAIDETFAQRGRGERRMPVAPAASRALGSGRTHTSNNECVQDGLSPCETHHVSKMQLMGIASLYPTALARA
jgi:hypothetical protein